VLLVAQGGFERLVRAVSRPALRGAPPEFAVLTPEMQAELVAQCAAQQIDILGPPID
jgi:hypothetical protein